MKVETTGLKRLTLEELLGQIELGSQYRACKDILEKHYDKFIEAQGSTHNHQCWPGGYYDHITDVMNIALQLWLVIQATGRMKYIEPSEQFSLSDALVVLFVHDLEKPWMYDHFRDDMTKEQREKFRRTFLLAHNLTLTPNQQHALKYVEGVRDKDYAPGARVESPLAAFCHTCDLWSARIFYDFPKFDDPWGDRVQSSTRKNA